MIQVLKAKLLAIIYILFSNDYVVIAGPLIAAYVKTSSMNYYIDRVSKLYDEMKLMEYRHRQESEQNHE